MLTDACVHAMLDAVTFDLASLHTAYSATGANEVGGGSPAYARKAVTVAAAASRSRAASTQPVFDVPATTVRFIGLWTAVGNVFRGMFANGGAEKGFQVDLGNDDILCESHGLVDNDKVVFYGGTVPAGLTEGTVYFVVGSLLADPDSFQVSLTLGGAAINITGQPAAQCKFSKIVEEVFGAQGTFIATAVAFGITE